MFKVTTLDPKNPPVGEDGEVDFGDFSGARLTLRFPVSLKPKPSRSRSGNLYVRADVSRREFEYRAPCS